MMKGLAVKLPSHQTVVMIGAGPGEFLLSFLEGYRYSSAKCTVIDIQTCEYVQAHLLDDEAIDDVYTYSVNFIIDNSVNVAKRWTEPIDLLIVDGDHTARGVQRDIQGWARFVRKYIWFHDYTGPDGTDEARSIIDAYALLDNWELVMKPSYSAVFRKRQ